MTVPDRDHVDRLIARVAWAHRAQLAGEQRALMRSELFDLPRRSSIGWALMHELVPTYIRRWQRTMSGVDLGRNMRRLCSRPNALQVALVPVTYLADRQQQIRDRGLTWGDDYEEADLESLTLVMTWWEDVQRGYRRDGWLVPEETTGEVSLLDDATVSQLSSWIGSPGSGNPNLHQRLAATLELYCLLLHGEQRDGIFGHGPYPLGDGRTLAVREYTDLANDFLPWTDESVRLPLAAVGVARMYTDVTVTNDFMGTLIVKSPAGGAPDPLGSVVIGVESDRIRLLSDDEVAVLTDTASTAQQQLFLRMAEWGPEDRYSYGLPLFANHLRAIDVAAGTPGERSTRSLSEAIDASRARLLNRFRSAEPPSMWAQFSDPDGPLYWPTGRF